MHCLLWILALTLFISCPWQLHQSKEIYRINQVIAIIDYTNTDVNVFFQLCENKPQVTEEQFNAMVVKAKEDLKVRHQQYLQQQEEERKKQAELAEQRKKEEEERERIEAEERERLAQEAKEQGLSVDHNQVSYSVMGTYHQQIYVCDELWNLINSSLFI